MKLSDFTRSMDINTSTTEPEQTPKENTSFKADDVTTRLLSPKTKTLIMEVNNTKIIEQNAQPKKEKIVYESTTPIELHNSYHNDKAWKKSDHLLTMEIKDLVIIISKMKNIVDTYQNDPDKINENVVNEFKDQVDMLNKSFNKNFVINSESTFKDYVEIMNEILTNVSLDLDNFKTKLATHLNKLKEELSVTNINKSKELAKSVWKDLQNKPYKLIGLVDHLLDAIYGLENINEEELTKLVKHHEYLIASSVQQEMNVQDSVSGTYSLSEEQIKKLVCSLLSFFKIVESKNRYFSYDNEESIHLTAKLLAYTSGGSGSVSRYLLDYLKQNDKIVEDKSTYIKQEVNNILQVVFKELGAGPDSSGKTGVLTKIGRYYIEDSKVVVKEETFEKRIKINHEMLNSIHNVLQSINIDKATVDALPDKLINLLKSESLVASDTDKMLNVTICITAIVAITNIYRNAIMHNILGFNHSVNSTTCSYYNIVNTILELSKKG